MHKYTANTPAFSNISFASSTGYGSKYRTVSIPVWTILFAHKLQGYVVANKVQFLNNATLDVPNAQFQLHYSLSCEHL